MCKIECESPGLNFKMNDHDFRDFNRISLGDAFRILIDGIYYKTIDVAHSMMGTIRRVGDTLQLTELTEQAGIKLAEHQVLAFILLVMALSCSIPVIVFLIFAAMSIIFTFAGFIFIEGMILAVGGIFLFGFLLSMILVMSVTAVLVGIFYFTFVKVGSLITSDETVAFVKNVIAVLSGREENIEVVSETQNNTLHQD